MRSLKIRFLKPNDKLPRATMTFYDEIPEDVFNRVIAWCKGEGKEFGDRKYLTINIIVTKKEEGEN